MAISSSLATKAGAVGTLVAGTGLGGTYLAWDHINYYEVERKVINTDFKLTVSDSTAGNKKITIEAPKSTTEGADPKLEPDYSWTCEITIDTEDALHTNLGRYIKNHLQIPGETLSDKQKENKNLLVKACAKNRKPDKTDKSVTGLLTISKDKNNFVFKDHSYLDFLLKWNGDLYEVEKKVINDQVGLKVSDENSGSVKIVTIETTGEDAVWKKEESGKYYWECKITGTAQSANFSSTEADKFLPKSSEDQENIEQKKNNKKHLVNLCAKYRTSNSSEKKVKSEFTLPSTETNWKDYLFGKQPS